MTYNLSPGTGGEMVIVDCIRDNRGHDVPRNVVSLHKIQEYFYGRSRKKGTFMEGMIDAILDHEYI